MTLFEYAVARAWNQLRSKQERTMQEVTIMWRLSLDVDRYAENEKTDHRRSQLPEPR